jgi:hypothetical protein
MQNEKPKLKEKREGKTILKMPGFASRQLKINFLVSLCVRPRLKQNYRIDSAD